MGWPFNSPIAPNVDADLAELPPVVTALQTVNVWLLGGVFVNRSGLTRTVTVTDTAGKAILYSVEIPTAGVPFNVEWSFLRVLGLKWSASGDQVDGKLWGWK